MKSSVVKHTQDLFAGKRLLDSLLKRGLEQHSYQVSHLIRLFVLDGSLAEAHHAFLYLRAPTAFAWSAIISAHAKLGQPHKALLLFAQMQESAVHADKHVYVAALTACCHCEDALCQGRCTHSQVIENGYDTDTHIGAVLIDLYIKSGFVHEAYTVFSRLEMQDVVTYTSMLRGFAQFGYPNKAVELFQDMQENGFNPNQASFVSILKACMSSECLDLAMVVHDLVIQIGYGSDTIVCNAMIDVYVACGTMSDARKVFSQLPHPDAVSWCTMITGYIDHGQGLDAQLLLQKLHQQGIHFDQALFICSLKVSSDRGALEQGQLVHAHILDSSLVSDLMIANALVHMYVCCGSFVDAWKVFSTLPKRNLVTWSTIIAGLSKYKQYEHMLECLEAMHGEDGRPYDATAYVTMMASCIDEGLVLNGFAHFKRMVERECISPTVLHYNCLIDLLSHIGRLREAADLLETIPFQHNFVGWTSLLSCCNVHNEKELGRVCSNHVLTSDKKKSTGFVLMSSMYAREA